MVVSGKSKSLDGILESMNSYEIDSLVESINSSNELDEGLKDDLTNVLIKHKKKKVASHKRLGSYHSTISARHSGKYDTVSAAKSLGKSAYHKGMSKLLGESYLRPFNSNMRRSVDIEDFTDGSSALVAKFNIESTKLHSGDEVLIAAGSDGDSNLVYVVWTDANTKRPKLELESNEDLSPNEAIKIAEKLASFASHLTSINDFVAFKKECKKYNVE